MAGDGSSNNGAGGCVASIKHLSKRIVASYILDWLLILAIVAAGGGISMSDGYQHAFSLEDPSISFPHQPDTVSTAVLFSLAIIVPGVIIFLVCMLFVPGRTAITSPSTALKWRRKIWEWNAGWMGLGLALSATVFFTESLKVLTGKPRPDLLARCDPDLSLLSQYTVSGLSADITGAPTVVDYRICRDQSRTVIKHGFAAWPSGHASLSWAGLLYLTLFLCAKVSISIPTVPSRIAGRDRPATNMQTNQFRHNDERPMRNRSAAAPIYLVILAFIPIGIATWIATSRYIDYRHAGFDIISGSLLGAFFAWFGFHWYHMPIHTGSGWSWGPRTRNRAFYIGLDTPTYVGDEGWNSGKTTTTQSTDVEQQQQHQHQTPSLAQLRPNEQPHHSAGTDTDMDTVMDMDMEMREGSSFNQPLDAKSKSSSLPTQTE